MCWRLFERLPVCARWCASLRISATRIRNGIGPIAKPITLGGFDPYSSSKACAEIVCAAYRSSFFPVDRLDEHRVALATRAPGNVIGGGDWSEDRLIPDLIRGFQAGQPVLIRRPKAIRPWQHVLEPLHGYMMLAEQLLQGRGQFAPRLTSAPTMRTHGRSSASRQNLRRCGAKEPRGFGMTPAVCMRRISDARCEQSPQRNLDGSRS